MARGHKPVVRRSLSPEEWLRIRIHEVAAWKVVASAATGPWEVRQAAYHAPGDYTFLWPWRRIEEGEPYGAPDGTFFFRARVRVPASLHALPVELVLETPTEVIASLDGRVADAFDPNRSRVPLVRRARAGQAWRVQLESYVRSGPDDMRIRSGPGWGCTQPWRSPRLVSYDGRVEQFLYDVQVALEVAACQAVEEEVRQYLLHHLDEAMRLVDRDAGDRRRLHRSLAKARAYLREHVYAATHLAAPGRLALIGHSHVDIAYHWRIRQGLRKNARTAAVQLALMDRHPELCYCHSQPYLYEQLQRHWPELYARVKRRIRSGRWEVVGALYVECDCNVPSGESLIRQFLLGKRFFLREFGLDVDTCWLPDVFGNSWIMPQILARSGIRYFVSNKMSTWNDTNRFPHTNFLWRGVDGTEVAACVPATHFNSWLAPDQVLANWEGFAEKLEVGESMKMIGFGDGGGGLTREILEHARRLGAFPGLPRTRMITAGQYLEEAFADRSKLAVWDDELYLEMHRGVTTTKAELKRLNRRCELAAREAEMFSCLAGRLARRAEKARLTDAWKQVLVCQFHDILPGSHTQPVGREAVETYRSALAEFESIKAAALEAISRHVATHEQQGAPWVVFNSLAWPHSGVAELPVPDDRPRAAFAADGRALPCQAARTPEGEHRLLVAMRDVPPVGHDVLYVRDGPSEAEAPLRATDRQLENNFLRVELDRDGQVVRLLDKRSGRDVLPAGQKANVLQLFEDKPGVYDAWDIVSHFESRRYALPPAEATKRVEAGPVRAVVACRRAFLDSRMVQRICLYRDLPRVDFQTWVDWRERNKLLKVAFPVDVLARQATFDLSYGSIQRPTHRNTSWDQAKFEVCCHKWIDLSQADCGVSLLNDCKYGCDVKGSVMRLSLLRGSIRPDPDSDLGEHAFTYSLLPHAGSWREAGTVRAAYELNCPLTAVRATRHRGELPARRAMVTLEAHGNGVHLGALKPAEDGRDVVVRLIEQHGGRCRAAVTFDQPLRQVQECDLLERPLRRLRRRKHSFTTPLAPFEIRSFLVRLA
jgi:alpha-mannosidase